MSNQGLNPCKVVLLGESGKVYIKFSKVLEKRVLFLDLLIINLTRIAWQLQEQITWLNL